MTQYFFYDCVTESCVLIQSTMESNAILHPRLQIFISLCEPPNEISDIRGW